MSQVKISEFKKPKIVSREEWTAARIELLQKEKELTHQRDRVREERSKLPWVKIEKNYIFDTPQGKQSLSDLFAGRSQLIIYHFMFGPEWKEGCTGCSFLMDHLEGGLIHLENHDVSVVVVSRAPLKVFEPFKRRMGWNFRWVSSFESDFNYDFHVSATKEDMKSGKMLYNYDPNHPAMDELHGESAFYKEEDGTIYHTYSSYARAGEMLVSTFGYLDIAPKGRNETGSNKNLGDWVKHHDKYEQAEGCGCECGKKG